MSTAGYSGTPLAQKLGIKEGFTIRLINGPEHYYTLFTDLPEKLHIASGLKEKKNFIHFFTKDAKELAKVLPKLQKEIVPDGIIWVSWPKKSSKVSTDVSENMIRDIALANGLLDIKVCAVDDIWSGLKLVIPVKDRVK